MTRRRVFDIALKGHPEGFQIAGDGERIFVNVPTSREVAVIDRRAGKQVAKWDLRYHGNFPMALDEQGQRVLVGFRSPPLDVLERQDGNYQRVTRIPTSPGSRTALFSPEQDRLFLAVRATPVEPAAVWIFRPNP
jgi:hypothetical protein